MLNNIELNSLDLQLSDFISPARDNVSGYASLPTASVSDGFLDDRKHELLKKLDMFMHNHILSKFRPEQIYWWFSLSGGKDSFSMCHSVYRWYKENGYVFNGTAFTIRQWANTVHDVLKKQIDWIDIIELDARTQTIEFTKYRAGNQAPCALCSKVRKLSNDEFLEKNKKKGFHNVIARGLHLSDTAISLLWRWVFYDDYVQYDVNAKYRPIAQINDDVFLAKPLCFVREKESEDYALTLGFKASCCGCPAFRYPSRRDIVEETLLDIYREHSVERWEFFVPGIDKYIESLSSVDIDTIESVSTPGFVLKHNHIRDDFYDHVVSNLIESGVVNKLNTAVYDTSVELDELAVQCFLTKRKQKLKDKYKMPVPRILSNSCELTAMHKKMIATLGPLWGSLAYTKLDREYVQKLQTDLTRFSIDKQWSQVNRLLNTYYEGDKVEDGK